MGRRYDSSEGAAILESKAIDNRSKAADLWARAALRDAFEQWKNHLFCYLVHDLMESFATAQYRAVRRHPAIDKLLWPQRILIFRRRHDTVLV
jgi:hypothetical protein